MVELRAEDLRFTHEEAMRFLNESMGLGMAPEAAGRLVERTAGWITGLQLAALSLQGHPDPEKFLEEFSSSHRYLVDYLVEEVLARQPEEVQRFLSQTAMLDRLCGPLCEAVTGVPGGQAMLERLEAAHLFLIPLDRERRWYRYHPLLATVLRSGLLADGYPRSAWRSGERRTLEMYASNVPFCTCPLRASAVRLRQDRG